jgi:hypothetical protein
MDLFTTVSPGYIEVSPVWNPPWGPESIDTPDETESADLHRYTILKVLRVSSFNKCIASNLPQEQGAPFLLECWLDVRCWRKGLWMEGINTQACIGIASLQSSELFTEATGNRMGNLIGSFDSCWGHALPNFVTSRTPSKGKGGCGSAKRRSPVLWTRKSKKSWTTKQCIRWSCEWNS